MSLTLVGKLLIKVVRISNGRKKRWTISVSYSCQLKKNAFHMLLGLPFVVFYHNMTRIYISKQYDKNRNLGKVLIIRKT